MTRSAIWFLAAALLAGCASESKQGPAETPKSNGQTDGARQGEPIRYTVDPETFSLVIDQGKEKLPVSLPGVSRAVEGLTENGDETSWRYPNEAVSVQVRPEADYLSVTIRWEAEGSHEFQWPSVSGDTYFMPFGEGKRIPADDSDWGGYLDGAQFTVLEQLSMPFWATVYGDYAVLFIMEQPYRNELAFTADPSVRFTLTHRYPEIDDGKENSFRIYVTAADPVETAKTYRRYVQEQGKLVTLEEKAAQNPNIAKLYGAPHIYLWGEHVIEPEDVNWTAFRQALGSPPVMRLKELASRTESGPEALAVLGEIEDQDYVSQYQKDTVCRYLSECIKTEGFYQAEAFPATNRQMELLLQNGGHGLGVSQQIRLNQYALAANLPDVFAPAEQWMDRSTVELLRDMKASGIDRAWIGLNSWEQAYVKPELVRTAVEQGYLIGPYDSYHSIHEPGKEQWITAKFPDASLYEDATIEDWNGEKVKGFQNVGRKLNPTLSLPSVKERVEEILSEGIGFNSWFIDCDATGEVYDDYSPGRVTTQQEDLSARLERMAFIRDKYSMVVGSEGGNDFAAPVIAFAHGIELKSFSWMDEDMKSNKESEYYIGRYYNPTGGVAEHFAKQIPLKELYYKIFVDPRYDVPLYKLVYNNSVITSYHWDWSTFKIKGAVEDRMLREILYNTPPLYHLDREEWEQRRADIVAHTKVWSHFSRQAVGRELTEFQYLTGDGGVQMSRYGEGLWAAANFTDAPFTYGDQEIPPHSILISADGERSVYTPRSGASPSAESEIL